MPTTEQIELYTSQVEHPVCIEISDYMQYSENIKIQFPVFTLLNQQNKNFMFDEIFCQNEDIFQQIHITGLKQRIHLIDYFSGIKSVGKSLLYGFGIKKSKLVINYGSIGSNHGKMAFGNKFLLFNILSQLKDQQHDIAVFQICRNQINDLLGQKQIKIRGTIGNKITCDDLYNQGLTFWEYNQKQKLQILKIIQRDRRCIGHWKGIDQILNKDNQGYVMLRDILKQQKEQYSYALDCCSVTCVLITSKKHDNFARNNFLFVDFSTQINMIQMAGYKSSSLISDSCRQFDDLQKFLNNTNYRVSLLSKIVYGTCNSLFTKSDDEEQIYQVTNIDISDYSKQEIHRSLLCAENIDNKITQRYEKMKQFLREQYQQQKQQDQEEQEEQEEEELYEY